MVNPIPEDELVAIIEAVRRHPDGITAQQIAQALPFRLPPRTLQYRLKHLVDARRLVKEGERRWTRYRLPRAVEAEVNLAVRPGIDVQAAPDMPLSPKGAEIRDYVRQPLTARRALALAAHEPAPPRPASWR